MRELRILAGLGVVVALLVGGCAGSQVGYTQPVSIYSTMDSTSLVYTNPRAASQVYDHPLRWFAFMMNPLFYRLRKGSVEGGGCLTRERRRRCEETWSR